MQYREQQAAQDTRIADLKPGAPDFNLDAKVLSVGATREVRGKDGAPDNKLCEVIGDGSANVVLTLWNDQVGSVREGDVIRLEDATVALVRGRLRVNLRRGASVTKSDREVEASSADANMTDVEHEDTRPPRRFGGSGGYGGDRRSLEREPRGQYAGRRRF